MFLLLVIVVGAHQMFATIRAKSDDRPLRSIVLRVIEFCGRVFILPLVTFYFIKQIKSGSDKSREILLDCILTLTAAIFMKEIFGLAKVFRVAQDSLIKKANNPDSTLADFSPSEILYLNLTMFKSLSRSPELLMKHIDEHGELEAPVRDSMSRVSLHNLKEFHKEMEMMNIRKSVTSSPFRGSEVLRRFAGAPSSTSNDSTPPGNHVIDTTKGLAHAESVVRKYRAHSLDSGNPTSPEPTSAAEKRWNRGLTQTASVSRSSMHSGPDSDDEE